MNPANIFVVFARFFCILFNLVKFWCFPHTKYVCRDQAQHTVPVWCSYVEVTGSAYCLCWLMVGLLFTFPFNLHECDTRISQLFFFLFDLNVLLCLVTNANSQRLAAVQLQPKRSILAKIRYIWICSAANFVNSSCPSSFLQRC